MNSYVPLRRAHSPATIVGIALHAALGSILALVVAIVVHEFGHFLVASLLGYEASMTFLGGTVFAGGTGEPLSIYTGFVGNVSRFGLVAVALSGSLLNFVVAGALPLIFRRKYNDIPLGIALACLLSGALSLIGDASVAFGDF